MKRKLALGIVLAVAVLVFLPFCNLTFDLSAPPSSLNLTNALVVYEIPADVQIQFSFTGEEDKHLCQYSVEKDGGTSFFLVDEGKVELLSGQVYKHTDISSYSYENGHYRFSISVLLERNGSYDSPPFLQESVDFWIDPTGPAGKVTFSVDAGSYNTAQQIELYHDELDAIDGSPARIFYTTNENDPISSWTQYIPGEPVTIATDSTLNAVAIDLADRPSDIATATYVIDSIPPIAPSQPTSPEGPFINEDEEAGGFEVEVALGTSGAQTGDELELLLNNTSFPSPLIRILTNTDISTGSYTFNVVAGQLGSDGDKELTAAITDKAGNPGSASNALTLILDTMDPDPPSANPIPGTYSSEMINLYHAEWPTSSEGTPVALFYTLDGTVPSGSSTMYGGTPISLPEGESDLKSLAIDEAGNASSVMIASYEIDKIAPDPPSLDHNTGEYDTPFLLTISHDEIPTPAGTDVQIYYTIGSIASQPSNPDCGSTLYTASIPIDRNRIVKAAAIDEVGNASTIVSRTYTFLRVDTVTPDSCSKTSISPIIYADVGGFFFSYDDTNINVYISDGSVEVPCYIDPGSLTNGTNLHINILREELNSYGISTGLATLYIENSDPSVDDSVFYYPFRIDP